MTHLPQVIPQGSAKLFLADIKPGVPFAVVEHGKIVLAGVFESNVENRRVKALTISPQNNKPTSTSLCCQNELGALGRSNRTTFELPGKLF